ncbi:hypothetical protein PR048_024397 [Dryococelus australis]|uniref:Uncharacterized protein n=1 Tax=Dryococelus australis TaxID=614101 RepID=A0ABQ9GNI9_9NEOP|nr:hypothetical protein PR048_024397 [Dryococelus australis]
MGKRTDELQTDGRRMVEPSFMRLYREKGYLQRFCLLILALLSEHMIVSMTKLPYFVFTEIDSVLRHHALRFRVLTIQSRSEGAIRATLTLTPSGSSLLCASKECGVSVVTLYCANQICNSGVLLQAMKAHRLNYALNWSSSRRVTRRDWTPAIAIRPVVSASADPRRDTQRCNRTYLDLPPTAPLTSGLANCRRSRSLPIAFKQRAMYCFSLLNVCYFDEAREYGHSLELSGDGALNALSNVTLIAPRPAKFALFSGDTLNFKLTYLFNEIVIGPYSSWHVLSNSTPINEHFTITYSNHVQASQKESDFISMQKPMENRSRLEYIHHWAAVVWQIDYSPPTWANRVRFLAGAAPGLSHLGIMPGDAAGRGVFSGISRFPALSFQCCSILTFRHPPLALKISKSPSTLTADNQCAADIGMFANNSVESILQDINLENFAGL